MRRDHLARIVWTAVNESLFYFPSGVRKIYPGLTVPQFFTSEPLSSVISFSSVFTVCGSDFLPRTVYTVPIFTSVVVCPTLGFLFTSLFLFY